MKYLKLFYLPLLLAACSLQLMAQDAGVLYMDLTGFTSWEDASAVFYVWDGSANHQLTKTNEFASNEHLYRTENAIAESATLYVKRCNPNDMYDTWHQITISDRTSGQNLLTVTDWTVGTMSAFGRKTAYFHYVENFNGSDVPWIYWRKTKWIEITETEDREGVKWYKYDITFMPTAYLSHNRNQTEDIDFAALSAGDHYLIIYNSWYPFQGNDEDWRMRVRETTNPTRHSATIYYKASEWNGVTNYRSWIYDLDANCNTYGTSTDYALGSPETTTTINGETWYVAHVHYFGDSYHVVYNFDQNSYKWENTPIVDSYFPEVYIRYNSFKETKSSTKYYTTTVTNTVPRKFPAIAEGKRLTFSTFCAPYNWSVPSNFKAYKASRTSDERGDIIELHELSGIIPAGAGVILASEVAQDNIDILFTHEEATADMSGNVLLGTTEQMTQPELLEVAGTENVLYLSSNATFKHLTEQGSLAAQRAYLPWDGSVGALAALRIALPDTNMPIVTGVEQTTATTIRKALVAGKLYIVRDNKVYNLNGRLMK